jgi:dethiobiotin synthetase
MPIIFVAGWGSGAGKSTVCQAVVQWIQAKGMAPAYIKPVTQCEAVTPVAAYCEATGVPHVAVGPVVFRSGVTNEAIVSPNFLRDRDVFLERAVSAVAALAIGNRTVVVDGVGYPSVGSCVGCGNGDVASALGAQVLHVCPDGLGDAIDTMELMVAYFRSKSCLVAGVLFNKVRDTMRHRRRDVEPLIQKYMKEVHPDIALLGFIPYDDTMESPLSTMVDFDLLLPLLIQS